MPRKDKPAGKTAQPLGRALFRSRFVGGGPQKGVVADARDGTRHVADLDDGSRMSRQTAGSVTHESDLDAFLSTAVLADTAFAAERASVRVVSQGGIFSAGDGTNGPVAVAAAPTELSTTATADRLLLASASNPYLLSPAEEAAALKEHAANRARLTVPRRPRWDEKTTAEKLQKAEKEAFLEWRRNLAELEEVHGLLLTPFERNLEIWRQLWRVVERSDLVVQIVDARNPLLFRSDDLEKYVTEFGTPEGPMPSSRPKKNLLVVNKADFLTVAQRKAWAEYFDRNGIRFAWFSAALAQKQQDEEKRRLQEEANRIEGPFRTTGSSSAAGQNDSSEDENDKDDAAAGSEDEEARLEREMAEATAKLGKATVSFAEKDDVRHLDADDDVEESGSEVSDEESLPEGATDDDEEADLPKPLESDSTMFLHAHAAAAPDETEDPATRILSVSELLRLLETECPEPVDGHKPTVGMVGYPNVGKSSTINVIAGSKRVAVSATPGKTKHFQTIHLPQTNLLLCDCPGLVFPTFATTKADLVTQGILPVDNMREHTGPAALLAMRIPRRVLEWTYGMVVRRKGKSEKREGWREDYCKPEELLQSYAIMRGFARGVQGNPDEHRAARYLLKDYINGRLLFCMPPADFPGTGEVFNAEIYAGKELSERRRKGQEAVLPTPPVEGGQGFDNEFFREGGNKDNLLPSTLGKFRQAGFSRSKFYPSQNMANDDGSASTMTGWTFTSSSTKWTKGDPGENGKRHWKGSKREKKRTAWTRMDD